MYMLLFEELLRLWELLGLNVNNLDIGEIGQGVRS